MNIGDKAKLLAWCQKSISANKSALVLTFNRSLNYGDFIKPVDEQPSEYGTPILFVQECTSIGNGKFECRCKMHNTSASYFPDKFLTYKQEYVLIVGM